MRRPPMTVRLDAPNHEAARWAAWPRPSGLSARREGVVLGLLVAAAIWWWLAVVDLVAGYPMYTFQAFGGVVPFTVAHVTLCVIYGIVVASMAQAAERTPSVVMALIFGAILFQTACAMVTAMLSQVVPVDLAWVRLFGGSLVGSGVTFAWLHRTHRLGDVLHEAERER
jgi:hypothetical protein